MGERPITDMHNEEKQKVNFERAQEILKKIIEETNKDGKADNKALSKECFLYLRDLNILNTDTLEALLDPDKSPITVGLANGIAGTLIKKKEKDPLPKDKNGRARHYSNPIHTEGDTRYHLYSEWDAKKLFYFLEWICTRGGMEDKDIDKLKEEFDKSINKDERAKKEQGSKREETTKAENDLTASSEMKVGVNLIIYGAPGTGKSYWVEHYNDSDRKEEKLDGVEIDTEKNKIVRVVFHPEYTYFDFVGQYRPCPLYKEGTVLKYADGTPFKKGEPYIDYQFVPGPFTDVLVKAYNDEDHMYTLLIEELNRADAAAIFGDVFQLFDRVKDGNNQDKKKGESEYGIQPASEWGTYLKEHKALPEDGRVKIPHNMNIIATMNSADQGVHVLDTAFKRRWKYVFMSIEDELKNKNTFGEVPYAKDNWPWKEFLTKINDRLQEQFNIKEDRLIGPYFASQDSEGVKKILFYLWDDVLRNLNRQAFFKSDIMTMGQLYNEYNEGTDVMQLCNKETMNNQSGNSQNPEDDQGDEAK